MPAAVLLTALWPGAGSAHFDDKYWKPVVYPTIAIATPVVLGIIASQQGRYSYTLNWNSSTSTFDTLGTRISDEYVVLKTIAICVPVLVYGVSIFDLLLSERRYAQRVAVALDAGNGLVGGRVVVSF